MNPASSLHTPLPTELQARLDADPALNAAFAALTPGRKRGYIFHFTSAKQPRTRAARVEKCIPQILAGKGIHDRPSPSTRSAPRAGATEHAHPDARKGGVILLSGGNPQIAKAEGDAPVQAYIAAMPGWKSALGQRLDALIVYNVPNVRKAVKWNSPFYGVEGQGWFLSFHVFTHFVKVTFFNGTSLDPLPPGGTVRGKESRWIDIHEDDFNEARMAAWVRQAAAKPGWVP